MIKQLVVLTLVVAAFATTEANVVKSELDDMEQLYKDAMAYLAKGKKQYSDEHFVVVFAGLLEGGATDLRDRTQEQLKSTTDNAKREELIQYASDAYKRLILFMDEVEESLQ